MESRFDAKTLGCVLLAALAVVVAWKVREVLGILALVLAVAAAGAILLKDPFGIYPKK